MFEQKGVVSLDKVEEEALLEVSMEGEADNYEIYDDEGAEVFTSIDNLEHLNQTFKKHDFPVKEVELRWIPSNNIEISDPEAARSLLKLIDTLESLDDVQNVTANFDLTEEIAGLDV